jgi:hypothetical protein
MRNAHIYLQMYTVLQLRGPMSAVFIYLRFLCGIISSLDYIAYSVELQDIW